MFDGVSPQRLVTDVRIVGGMIAEMGPNLRPEANNSIDARDMWVTPGFIDAHSHADASVLTGDGMEYRAMAGVTTEVVGQDGLGLSFAAGSARDVMSDTLAPLVGELPAAEFGDISSYLAAVDRNAFARVATLVPHGAVRATVMGRNLREAGVSELREMRTLIQAGLMQGAVGVSTGLSYSPALAASTDELVDILSGLPAGLPYVTHLRSYGEAFDESLNEAYEICERTGLSLHLSHFHVSGEGRDGLGYNYAQRLVASSPSVTWDTYPYTAGCTFITSLLPVSAQSRSVRELVVAIADPFEAARLARALDEEGPGPTVATGWASIVVAGLHSTSLRAWDKKSIADIASEARTSCGGVVLQILSETMGDACVLVNQGHLDNVLSIASAPGHHVGSDGIIGAGMPHPRVSNSFYRFLSWAHSRLIPVSVEEMVARMTSRTARRFGLGTGILRVGAPADILVIDPTRLEVGPDIGHYRPRALQLSFLEGERVVFDGEWCAPQLPGLALRKER